MASVAASGLKSQTSSLISSPYLQPVSSPARTSARIACVDQPLGLGDGEIAHPCRLHLLEWSKPSTVALGVNHELYNASGKIENLPAELREAFSIPEIQGVAT
jgi:hypothetical protein